MALTSGPTATTFIVPKLNSNAIPIGLAGAAAAVAAAAIERALPVAFLRPARPRRLPVSRRAMICWLGINHYSGSRGSGR